MQKTNKKNNNTKNNNLLIIILLKKIKLFKKLQNKIFHFSLYKFKMF